MAESVPAIEVTGLAKRYGTLQDGVLAVDHVDLTVRRGEVFGMQLYGVPRPERARRADELLARFRLADKRDVPFARFSRGMKRALTLKPRPSHRSSTVWNATFPS